MKLTRTQLTQTQKLVDQRILAGGFSRIKEVRKALNLRDKMQEGIRAMDKEINDARRDHDRACVEPTENSSAD